MTSRVFDLAVIGGGVLGLAHAYVAAKAGKRVAVIERDVRANGASIRNFGFITVTGQERGESWRLARRTRDIWAAVAVEAGLRIEQRGLYLTARSADGRGDRVLSGHGDGGGVHTAVAQRVQGRGSGPAFKACSTAHMTKGQSPVRTGKIPSFQGEGGRRVAPKSHLPAIAPAGAELLSVQGTSPGSAGSPPSQ
jgi:hypothetical protein